MRLEQILLGPHEQRLEEVRRLTEEASRPTEPERAPEPEEAEERLRVAMVRLLPRAGESDQACERLLDELTHLWEPATADVRALDAWHNGYEAAVARGLGIGSSQFRAFLKHYAALLEVWIAASS
jgi:hypothetical protein